MVFPGTAVRGRLCAIVEYGANELERARINQKNEVKFCFLTSTIYSASPS